MRWLHRIAILAALLGAATAHAQVGDRTLEGRILAMQERVADLLARGDTSEAYREVVGMVDRLGEVAPLLEIRLRLERTGVGLRRYPLPVRRRRVVAAARRLRELDPGNALALETLADDAVATALFFRDRGPRFPSADATRTEANVRLRGSRFDVRERAAVRPLLDRTGAGRDATADAIGFLESLLPTDPVAAAPFLVSVGVAYRQWPLVARAAERLEAADPARAALVRTLAAWRTGRPEDANAALATALPLLQDAERTRLLDLTPLLSPTDTAAYRADPDAVAARFWADADPRRITGTSERRTEHVVRVLEADALFGRTLGDLFTDRAWRGAETDRGRVWVRYGPPDRETGFTQDDTQPTYSRDAVAAYAVWEYDRLGAGTRFVFDDPVRTGAYRTYSPPASAYAETNGRAAVDDYVTLDRDLQSEQPELYVDTLAAALPLVAARFRSAAGATEVVVAFPVAEEAQAGVFVGETAAEATRGVAVVRLDSAATVRAETLAGDRFAVAAVRLAPFTQTGFGISDLLVVGGSGAAVERRGERLAPVIADTLGRAAPVQIYAEVYGLALRDGRASAEAEARLVPLDERSGVRRFADRMFGRRQRRGVSVATEVEGRVDTEMLELGLDASGLSPGAYLLALRVTDRHSGQSAEAERTVVLD